jgi:hypothetical protein
VLGLDEATIVDLTDASGINGFLADASPRIQLPAPI